MEISLHLSPLVTAIDDRVGGGSPPRHSMDFRDDGASNADRGGTVVLLATFN